MVDAANGLVVEADAPPSAPNGEAEPEEEPNSAGFAPAPAPKLPKGEAELVNLAKPDEAKAELEEAEAAGLSSLLTAPDDASVEVCYDVAKKRKKRAC